MIYTVALFDMVKAVLRSSGAIDDYSWSLDRHTNVKGHGTSEGSWSGQFRVAT